MKLFGRKNKGAAGSPRQQDADHGLRLKERAPDGEGSPMVRRFPEHEFKRPSRLRPLVKRLLKAALVLVVLGAILGFADLGAPPPIDAWESTLEELNKLKLGPDNSARIRKYRAAAGQLVAIEKAISRADDRAFHFWRKRERESSCAVSTVLALAYLAAGRDKQGLAIRDYTVRSFEDTVFVSRLSDEVLYINCRVCRGAGSRKCDRCNGSTRCPACQGRGKIVRSNGKTGISRADMRKASGGNVKRLGESGMQAGRTTSKLVQGGRTCSPCRGEGRCPRCEGRGKISKGCRDCDGTGSTMDQKHLDEVYTQAMLDAARMLQSTLRRAKPRRTMLRVQSVFRRKSRDAFDKGYGKISELEFPELSGKQQNDPRPADSGRDADAGQ